MVFETNAWKTMPSVSAFLEMTDGERDQSNCRSVIERNSVAATLDSRCGQASPGVGRCLDGGGDGAAIFAEVVVAAAAVGYGSCRAGGQPRSLARGYSAASVAAVLAGGDHRATDPSSPRQAVPLTGGVNSPTHAWRRSWVADDRTGFCGR